MSKLKTFIFAATVKQFQGSNERPAEADKNDLMPVILDVIAGSCPNVRVLSGTVAARGGMAVGEGYLIKAVETGAVYEKEGSDEVVPQYNFSTMGRPLSIIDTFLAIEKLGEPRVVEVVRNTDEDEAKDNGNGNTIGNRTVTAENFNPEVLSKAHLKEWEALDSDEARAEWLEAHTEYHVI